jgi:prepilin-type processing-associated H-X9-DG protein
VPPEANGAFQSGSGDRGVRMLQIKDGPSNTILAGEKHVPWDKFGYGGWDCSMYNGLNGYCSSRAGGIGFPIAQSVNDPNWRWGSYHANICQFVFADGHVQRLSPAIDEVILGYLCQINDGQPIPPYE